MKELKLPWIKIEGAMTQYSGLERIIIGLSLVVVCLLVLRATAKAVGSKHTDVLRTLLVLLLGLAAVLFAPSIMARICNSIPWHIDLHIQTMIIITLLFLAIVIPLACILWKVNYLKGLFTVIIGTIAAVLTVILVHYAFSAFQATTTDMKKIREKKEEDTFLFK